MRLDAVSHDVAAAVLADRSTAVNGALETIEHVRLAGRPNLERLVVRIPTDPRKLPCVSSSRPARASPSPRQGKAKIGGGALALPPAAVVPVSPEDDPGLRVVSGYLKDAVTFCHWFMVTVQELAVPLHAPAQPAKL